jgi:hypothetical protein
LVDVLAHTPRVVMQLVPIYCAQSVFDEQPGKQVKSSALFCRHLLVRPRGLVPQSALVVQDDGPHHPVLLALPVQ